MEPLERQSRHEQGRDAVASDLMTRDPQTISADASVEEAFQMLEELDVRHIPVVDNDGNLVGMLSDRDLGPLRDDYDESNVVRRARTRVVERMTSHVVFANTDTDIEEIVDLMLDHRIGAVPVVDGEGHVVGIVSYVDVLRTLVAG